MGDVQQPTFSWTGTGRAEGARTFYDSFIFSGELYAVGDCVYLLPEEEGAPPYIAKLLKAYEDSQAAETEKLVIEVQWYERRSGVPAAVAAEMHDREVVASDLTDTNLVGCLDRKATVLRAPSYAQALELLPSNHRQMEWHFCRGVLESESQRFRTYQELGQPVFDGEQMPPGMPTYCNGQQQQQQQLDEEMPDAADIGSSHRSTSRPAAANNRSRRAAAAARVAAAAAAAGAGNGANGLVRGIPGKVCCECGATQTPQWREGPLGPKTLCNACGVRYQRSQSKAKSNKRQASERNRDRGSPMHSRAPKQACVSRSGAAGSTAVDGGKCGVTADGSSGGHGHGTRSSTGKCSSKQQLAAHRNGVSTMIPCGHEEEFEQQRCGSSRAGGRQQRQQQPQHLGAGGMNELHYYEDAGSPPNMNTHILEEDDDEAMQQQLLRNTLNRSATHEAADTLQTLSTAPQQQQQQQQQAQQQQQQQAQACQQQQQQHRAQQISAAFCSSVIGSPSSSMLLSEQLQPDSMPLLSLDEKLGGADGVLTGLAGGLNGPDSLDASLTGINNVINSMSPVQHRTHRLSATTTAGSSGRDSSSSRFGSAASAVCASPGRLIAAMVQGLKVPAPLNLNGPGPSTVLPPPASAAALAPAAGPGDVGSRQQQPQQHQQQPLLLSTNLLGGQGVGQLPVGIPYHPHLLSTGNGLLLPLIGSSSNISQQMGGSSTATPAATPGMHGSDSQPTSAAVSSCETAATAAAAAAAAGVSSSIPTSTAAGQLSSSNGNNSLVSQLRSLVFRATCYTPDIQGLSGLYPGPSSPRAMQNLVTQLESLPDSARVQLQQVTASVEDNLSKAKAAEAAVLAVTQVLAAKKQAAADARREVENSVLRFRALLGQVSPAVAAAAAGNCSSSANGVYCSPTAAAAAAGGGCCTAVSSAAGAAGSDSCCLVGSSRLGGNSPRVLVSQGLCHHPTQGFNLGPGGEGLAEDTRVQGLGDASDADDLIRDPEDDNAAAATPAAAAAAGADVVQPHQDQAEVERKKQQREEQQQMQLDQQHKLDQDLSEPAAPTAATAPQQQQRLSKLEVPVKMEVDQPAAEDAAAAAAAAVLDVKQEQQQVQEGAASASGSSDGQITPEHAAQQQQQQQQQQVCQVPAAVPAAAAGPVVAVVSAPATSAAHPSTEAAPVAA